MPVLKYLVRLSRMNELIRRKATGTPEEFASKMNMSRSALMRELSELKNLNAPIQFDHDRQTYYYNEEGTFEFGFKRISEVQMQKEVGGWNYLTRFYRVPKYETAISFIRNDNRDYTLKSSDIVLS